MANQTPIQDGAVFLIMDDATGLPVVLFHNGDGDPFEICQTTPGSNPDHLDWLVGSAAAFHGVPVERMSDE